VIGRLRVPDLVAGAGGFALLASMFLHWYGLALLGGPEVTAWQAFSVLDVVLALLALVPLALVVLQATRESPSLPAMLSTLTVVAGMLATLLIGYRIVDQPGANAAVGVDAGAWLALAAAVVTTGAGWRSLADESSPGRAQPAIEELPAPEAGAHLGAEIARPRDREARLVGPRAGERQAVAELELDDVAVALDPPPALLDGPDEPGEELPPEEALLLDDGEEVLLHSRASSGSSGSRGTSSRTRGASSAMRLAGSTARSVSTCWASNPTCSAARYGISGTGTTPNVCRKHSENASRAARTLPVK